MEIEKIELNSEGIRELLRSPEMGEICKEYADKAVETLGEGYEAEEYVGKGRVNASVSAVTKEAIRENSGKNTVLKAVFRK